MPRLRLISCLASAVALATGCTAPQSQPQPLVIGLLTAMTGINAASGADAVRGAELAVEVINGSYPELSIPLAAEAGLPHLRGATLTLVSGDTGAKAELATVQAAALVTERHAVAVVVADSAEIAAATGSQMQRLRAPLIDVHSTADYLTELGMDWYFRTGPGDRELAEGAFALLRQQPHGSSATRIALVAEAGGDSAAASARITDLAVRAGSTIVARQELTGADSGAGDLVSHLSGKAAHAIFAWAHTATGADSIVRAAGLVAGSPPLFGLGPGFRHLERLPATSPALMRAVPWSAEFARRSPAGQSVMKLYEQRFGHPMTATAADAFTAVIALAVAIDAAGSGDPAAIRTALRQTSLPATQMIMPWNGLRFGADGQNQLAAAVVEEWDDHSFRLVYPTELASGPVRWSRPGPGK